jgi:hypothetical protein
VLRSAVLLLTVFATSLGCEPRPLGAPGAKCTAASDCAAGLQCVAEGCVDPTTPAAQGLQAAAQSLNIFESLQHSKVEAATNELLMLRKVAEQYTLIRPGQCPKSMLDLKDVGVVARVKKDPWDSEYQFTCPGKDSPVDVLSLGPDRKPGGGDDITGAEAVEPAGDPR